MLCPRTCILSDTTQGGSGYYDENGDTELIQNQRAKERRDHILKIITPLFTCNIR